MTLDTHTQGKLSAGASFLAALGAMTVTQMLSLLLLIVSLIAACYSIYCSRLTAKKEKLEIAHLERLAQEKRRSKN